LYIAHLYGIYVRGSGASGRGRYVDVIWQAIAEWWPLTLLFVAIGLGSFGGFIHKRLGVKDKLKLEKIRSETKQLSLTLEIERSKEREAALQLRRMQIEHGLPTHYIPILDDAEPKKELPE
jgi:hypothetical protein